MANRLYEIAFRIGGKIAASFPQSLKSASGQLAEIGSKIANLEKAQGQVTRFRALKNEIDETKKKLSQAEAEVRHLGATMGPMTADMARKFEAAKGRAEKLRLEFRGQASELRNVKTAMEAAGVAQRSLTADSARMSAQLQKAQAQQKRMQLLQGSKIANDKAKEAARSRFDASKGKMVGAAAGVAAVALPAIVAAKFEDSMVRAGALVRATDAEMAAMTAQARQLGRDTRFSASQGAEGMQFLAMSGFKASEIMSAMPGMLDIAAAGMVDVGTAADITSNILRGFGMEAGQSARLGDVLTNAFTNSNTTLAALGDTMKYVAPVAKATGLSLEKTAAAAGVLANAGIKGEQAGTAMRAMLSRLAAPPKKARDALASLGVKVLDAKKNMLPLDEILGSLNKKLAKMGTGARQGKITNIFGMEAATAATVLLSGQASGALAEMTAKVAKSGTAAEIAAKQNATMAGQWDNFKGSVEDVGIALGYKLIPLLKSLVDTVVPVINKITEWMDKHPKLTQTLIIGAAAVAALNFALVSGGLALNGIRLGLVAAKGALIAFRTATIASMAATAAPIALAAVGIAGISLAAYDLYRNWGPIKEWWENLWDGMGDSVMDTIASVVNGITPLLRMAGFQVDDMRTGVFTNLRRQERNWKANEAAAKNGAWKIQDLPLYSAEEIKAQGKFNMLAPENLPGALNKAKPTTGPGGGLDSWLDRGGIVGSVKSMFSSDEFLGNSNRGASGKVTYSPTINLPPGSPKETEEAAKRGLDTSQREFETMMKRYMNGQGRLSFGQ